MNLPKLIVIALMAGFTVIAASAIVAPREDKPKNLKVLPKNISGHDLDLVMDEFESALNVECNFCHVKEKGSDTMNYAKDDKAEKQIARKMMRMTIDINKKHFLYTPLTVTEAIQPVTCFTCHRGKARPVGDTLRTK